MRLPISCQKCNNENRTESFFIEVNEQFFKGQDIVCPHGHAYFLYVDTPKFAFLFQEALESFRTNFYFECFHTLYAGFEFYKKEFVEVVLLEQLKNIDNVQEYSKTINRAEVIEGAFKLAYIQKFGTEPPKLPRDIVELRNNVVHNGTIPSEKDCIKLGDAVFKIVIAINKLFHDETNEIIKSGSTDIGFQGFLAYNFQKFASAIKSKGMDLSLEHMGKYQRISFAINSLSPHTYYDDSTDNLFQKFVARETNILNIK